MSNSNNSIDSFRPSYVWPNPAFYFRLYYESDKCRIFLIENIVHNWIWLRQYAHLIRKNDYFFVQLGWYFGDWLADESSRAIEILGLDKSKFRIMFPDLPAKSIFESHGFQGDLVNHNAFLDEKKFKIINTERIYDAIYVARFAPFKRHYLASKIKNLALVAGNSWGTSVEDIPPHAYLNDKPLDADGVVGKLAESKVGVLLSEFEGACYSSSEYLLCGLPVVSTWSHGGRDVWYNDYNSIICDANPDLIAEAVQRLASFGRKREKIRETHIQQANYFRSNFVNMISDVFAEVGDTSISARECFESRFKHKMLTSETPAFELIFN
jgi:glycosyltransferase involved in cell wall biosynthesis